jgi:hypothetical protein
LDELVANYADFSVNPAGYGLRMLWHGPGELDADIAFDNFRVVPKTLE